MAVQDGDVRRKMSMPWRESMTDARADADALRNSFEEGAMDAAKRTYNNLYEKAQPPLWRSTKAVSPAAPKFGRDFTVGEVVTESASVGRPERHMPSAVSEARSSHYRNDEKGRGDHSRGSKKPRYSQDMEATEKHDRFYDHKPTSSGTQRHLSTLRPAPGSLPASGRDDGCPQGSLQAVDSPPYCKPLQEPRSVDTVYSPSVSRAASQRPKDTCSAEIIDAVCNIARVPSIANLASNKRWLVALGGAVGSRYPAMMAEIRQKWRSFKNFADGEPRISELRRNPPGALSQQSGHHAGPDEARDLTTSQRKAPLSCAQVAVGHEPRRPQGRAPPSQMAKAASAGGRPLVNRLNRRIVEARSAEDILAIVEAEHGSFDAVNAATACSQLAKSGRGSGHKDDRRVRTLFSTLSRVLPTTDAWGVASMLWALATLQWPVEHGLRSALEAEVARFAPSMNWMGVMNTVWALATLGWQGKPAMRSALEGAVQRVAPSMDGSGVEKMLWALATLRWQAGEGAMRSALEGALGRFVPSMKAHDVGNTVWALATLGWQAIRSALEAAVGRVAPSMNAYYVGKTLWALATLGWQAGEGAMRSAMEGAVMQTASSMDAYDVSNTLWGLATLGWEEGEREMLGAVVRVAPSMNAQGVANTLWALATLWWGPGEYAFLELTKSVLRVVSNMSAKNVANILWAFATLGWQAGDGAMCALEKHVIRVASSMSPQDVGNALWALATLGWQVREGPHRGELERAIVRASASMNAEEVANTVWALATLGWQAANTVVRGPLEQAVVRVAPSMSAQDVVSTVWGLAALGWTVADPHMADRFEASVKALFVDSRRSDVPPAMLTQLFQAHLTSQLLGPTLIALPSPILREAMKAYTEQAQKHTISNDQREVGESLHRLGISYEIEYIAADMLPSIDLAIVGRRIALELDGPSHFTTNTLEPLGHIRMRGRLLSAMGWHVVSIPCFEWSRLRQPFERDAYVLALLRRLPQA